MSSASSLEPFRVIGAHIGRDGAVLVEVSRQDIRHTHALPLLQVWRGGAIGRDGILERCVAADHLPAGVDGFAKLHRPAMRRLPSRYAGLTRPHLAHETSSELVDGAAVVVQAACGRVPHLAALQHTVQADLEGLHRPGVRHPHEVACASRTWSGVKRLPARAASIR